MVPHHEARRDRGGAEAGPQEGVEHLQVEGPDVPLDLRDCGEGGGVPRPLVQSVLRGEDVAVRARPVDEDGVGARARLSTCFEAE